MGRELCTNPGDREGARARAAVPQLWEQKLKVAFCMVTEENPLFSWLAVNAVFLSSLGLFPRERWDHKPHSKGSSPACIPARGLASRVTLA